MNKSNIRSQSAILGHLILHATFLSFSILFFQQGDSQVSQTFTSSGSFTVPAGVSSIKVELWGGGGAGGGVTSNGTYGGAGGAGGSYAAKTLAVTALATYSYSVGSGGNASTGNGASGGHSWFSSSSTVQATGGSGGQANNGSPGAGSTAGCVGSVIYAGGSGSSGSSSYGGGGGGAGSTGPGGAAASAGISGGTGTSVGGGDGADGIPSAGSGVSGNTAGGGGSGAYTTSNTNYSGGSGAGGQVTITYNPPPILTSFSPSNGCVNSATVVITGSYFTGATTVTIGGTNASSFIINSSTQITASVGTGTTGTIQVTTSFGTGTSVTPFTVNVLPATSTITAGSSTTFCAGGSVTLTSSAGISYLWSTGATTASISPSTAGSYTVKVTNASGCQSASSTATTVTVKALPATPTITAGGSTTFCAGGSVTLTSSAGTSYLWSTGANTASISPSTAGSYTVKVTNASGCQSASSTATTVTVNALPATPTITAGGSTTFCAGGSVTLTSSAGTAYLWSTGATTASISPSTDGSYTVKVTNASGCQSASSTATTVTVNALPATPTITAGGSTTFCAGGSVTLASSAGTSYLWSTGVTTASISPSTAGSYTVQVTNASGCQSASSTATTVTVNALPATPTITAGGSTTFCAGGSVTLTSSAGTSYLWSTGATTSSISPSTAGSYTIKVTNASGCQSASSAAATVTVNALPATPTASVTAQPTCSVGTGTITITAPMGAGLSYSTDGVTYLNTTGTFNSMSPGTYSLTTKNSSGCFSSIISITINAQPTTPNISQIPTTNLIANYKFNGNANDETGADNGTLQNGPAATADRFITSNSAYNFNGSNQYVSTANSYVNPADFTVSIWFKTNTATGGKLIGFGNAQTGSSGNYDRHIYMNNAGEVYFGVYPGSVVTVSSPLSYNDNTWHLATATLSATLGMALYIDGVLVSSNAGTKTAQSYTGYWRIGYDNNSGWTSAPSSFFFNGILDDALIYSRALTTSEITTLYSSPDGAGNSGPVCAGSSLSFNATTVSGATYAWTGPNSFSSSAKNPILSYTAANAGVYNLVVTSSAGCTANAYTTVTSLMAPGQWTGNVNSNWYNANNWCSGTLPVISTDVIIAATAPNMAVVTHNQLCNNILINTGASLNIDTGGTLQIAGTLTNSGTLNAAMGTIEMKGTMAQTIPANAFGNNALGNLIVNNTSAAGVFLGGPLDIYGSVTFSGTGKVLVTNDNLTIKSTASYTAWVGDVTGNTITGKATVEKYIAAHKAWQFLSVPTNTTQTVKQTWQEGASASGLNPVPGFGTQMTSNRSTWAADGFDLSSVSPSLKTFNPATGNWDGVTSTNSGKIKATEGYFIFVRGDRDATSTNSTPTQTVLRTKGNLYTGDQPSISVASGKFAAIGNPFASALDMRNIIKTGLKDFFYLWDPKLAGDYGFGGYQTFSNNGSGNYVITPGGGSYGAIGTVSNYIKSGLAFFVQATATGGSLTFKESSKSNASGQISTPVSLSKPQLLVALTGINPDNTAYIADGVLVNYDDSYSNGIDEMDALKSYNTSENLSVKTANTLLVVERRQTIKQNDTIFLNLANVKQQRYSFQVIAEQLYKPGLAGFMVDNYLKTRTPLAIDGSAIINFSVVNVPGSYATNRFMIVFSDLGTLPVTFTSLKAYLQGNSIEVVWKVDNESNIKQYDVEKSLDGNAYSKIAITPATANGGHAASYEITDEKPAPGINYYRVKFVDLNGKTAYTIIVKVIVAERKPQITIYPNPVINGTINLQLVNQPAGKYNIKLLNSQGQSIILKQIEHPGGNGSYVIQLDKYAPRGIYHLEMHTPDNKESTFNVIN